MDSAPDNDAIIVESLCKTYGTRRGSSPVFAVDDVSFRVPTGSTMGLVGESGSGKSTIARLVTGLIPADSGTVQILGEDLTGLSPSALRARRADLQIVFQEPFESLDPRMRIGDAIAEPLRIHTDLRGEALTGKVKELLELVALDASLSTRYPHQLSGGQQQRVNIARAIATDPKVLILDEPTSSLDVSVRVGVLQLVLALQKRLTLTYLLISHDLPTVRRVADAVAVMYLGRIVEIGPVETILTDPKHPYTEYLLASELTVNPEDQLPEFAVREAKYVGRPKVGCVFATRCPIAEAACETDAQTLQEVAPGHEAACMVRTRNNA